TDEIRFGDNDRLAARVSAMISADTLVLLSDIDGLYTADPTRDPNATFIPEVHEITPEIEAMGGKAGTDHGSGGMVTKLAAARICLGAGCRMVIARGNVSNPLKAILDGAPCTWFLPSASPGASRKQWIRGSLKTVGSLRLDAGALKALHSGRSLLPAGVTAIEGKFPPGSAVAVLDADGNEVARGISAYSSDEARKIMGRKSSDIETILGYRRKDELIHRDDLVLT
ncbi:MAG: glutamate 5-kinase, partial [Rhodospirillales bacterium]|nr:glutamate 5-kinase [Rhodospirillales bacterium]